MFTDIYLMLCGENERSRPRSRKLLSLIKGKETGEYKIIVSGLSSFIINPESSESYRASKYLIRHGVDPASIILEERSMDTLGNIIFSYDIVAGLCKQYDTIQKIIIVTESLHLHRVQFLFEHVFTSLINRYKFEYTFEGTTQRKTSLSFNIKKFKKSIGENPLVILNRLNYDIISLIETKEIKELFLIEIFTKDFMLLKLRTITQYKHYLYSLPLYEQIYPLSSTQHAAYVHSFYRQLILYHINGIKIK